MRTQAQHIRNSRQTKAMMLSTRHPSSSGNESRKVIYDSSIFTLMVGRLSTARPLGDDCADWDVSSEAVRSYPLSPSY
jgi:hypothetical protein